MSDVIEKLLAQVTLYEKLGIAALIVFGFIIAFLSKSTLRVPGGRGFKHISLPRLSSSSLQSALRFTDLVRGMLVIGGAGSGKTKSLIEPLIKQAVRERYTGIIYDFKFPVLSGVLYTETLLSADAKINYYYVNFTDLNRSHRFNVFKRIENGSYAQEYATAFMMNLLPESIKNTDFFLRTATSLFAASILFFNRRNKDICTLPHIMSFLLNPDISIIVKVISQEPEAADMVASVRSGLASEKQTAGVVSTLQNSLSLCANPNVFWVLSGDDFDLGLNNPESPKLLSIGNSALLIDSISPLASLIITVASKQMNQPEKEKSMLLLDEGPTLFIPNFDSIPATGRENKIATIYCGQDISQMQERYGEKKAEVLIANLSNQFYGKISNTQTAEKVVRLFGKEEVEIESKSSNRSSRMGDTSTGSSRSPQQRDRISITQIRELKAGEFVASTIKRGDFKIRCDADTSEKFPLPEITYVNDAMVQENYLRIKREVLELFEEEKVK